MRRRLQRGQAMVEYSVITWALVVGLLFSATVRIIPGPREGTAHRPPMSLVELFLYSYQTYYDTYLYSLGLPFP